MQFYHISTHIVLFPVALNQKGNIYTDWCHCYNFETFLRKFRIDFKVHNEENDNDSVVSKCSDEFGSPEPTKNYVNTFLKRSDKAIGINPVNEKSRNEPLLLNALTNVDSISNTASTKRPSSKTVCTYKPNLPKPSRILTNLDKEDEIDKMMDKYSNLKVRMGKCKDKVLSKGNTRKHILVLRKKQTKISEVVDQEEAEKIKDFKKYETTMKSAIKGLAKAIVLARNKTTHEVEDFTPKRKLGERNHSKKLIIRGTTSSSNLHVLEDNPKNIRKISNNRLHISQKRREYISHKRPRAVQSMNALSLLSEDSFVPVI
ncbi:unnamed protein product [Moneuplotes crassus]|uniref:Uncharacterized protein n=1 Tax=Euplotes crassus TaxID=5936 RepID=A0AAD2DAN4_EUPCR|nr:unnamed protein product [Moneuplotes crassus]